MTDPEQPKPLRDDDLDAAHGGGTRTTGTLRKPRGQDGVLLFDEADAIRSQGTAQKVVASGGGNDI